MNRSKFLFGIIVLVVLAFISINAVIGIGNASNHATIKDCMVRELVQQSLMKGSNGHISTEIRYLVITDKETFVCETSYLNDKFNSSSIFFNLKEGSSYDFTVAGLGKSIFTDYRNILKASER